MELPRLIDESGFSLVFDSRVPEDVANVVLDEIGDRLDLLSYLVNDGGAPAEFRAWREREVQRLPPEQAELVAQLSLPMLLNRFKQRCLDEAGVVRSGGLRARRGWAAYGLSREAFNELVRRKQRREVDRLRIVNDVESTSETREMKHLMEGDANGWRPREVRSFTAEELGDRPRYLTREDVAIGRVGEGIDRRRK